MLIKKTIIIFFFVFVLSQSVKAQTNWNNQSSSGYSALRSAIKIAKDKGKPLLIDFYASWCGPCRYFSEDSKVKADLISALNKVYLHKVDIEAGEGLELAQKNRFGIKSLPAFVLVDARREEIVKKWIGYGSSEEFSNPADVFIDALNKALDEFKQTVPEYAKYSKMPDNLAVSAANEAFNKGKYWEAYRIFEVLQKVQRQKIRAEKERLRKASNFSVTKVIGEITISDYTSYDKDLLKCLVRGRIEFLRWQNRDFLGTFGEERVANIAKSFFRNYDKKPFPEPWHYAEAANELALLSTEEHVPFLSKYLTIAWTRANSIDKTHPLLFSRLKSNYYAIVKKDYDTALTALDKSFKAGWQYDPEAVYSYASWCFAHKVNLSEATELIRDIEEKITDKKLKSKLLYRLATLEREDFLQDALDTLDLAMSLINKYSLSHYFMENQKKSWEKSTESLSKQ